jgi:general secretion pathway protein G
MKQGNQKGFTLIELLVVTAIIGLLSAIAVGNYQRSIRKAKESVLRENLWTMRSQINMYFADKGRYPYDLQQLVDDRYLRKIPKDPVTDSTSTWIPIPADFAEEDISLEPGIMDVQSGANGTGMDGSSYAEW